MDMDSFRAFINDDITWCANKCDEKECFRNPIHMKILIFRIHTATLKELKNV